MWLMEYSFECWSGEWDGSEVYGVFGRVGGGWDVVDGVFIQVLEWGM